MAGSRPSQFKKAGGFLNDVDGEIVNYEFTDEYPLAEGAVAKKVKESDFHALYAVLTVKVDNAEEEVTTTLFAGDADAFEIEDDGHTLEPVDATNNLSQSCDWCGLVSSAVDAGFPEESLPEDSINFESLIGKRFRFGQAVVLDKKTGKPRQRVAKKGKFAGKSFDVTRTIVTAYYGETNAKPAKANGKAVATKSSKAPKADDYTALAIETLVAILTKAKGHVVSRPKLSMLFLNALLKVKNRDAIVKFATSDKFLELGDGWTYDSDAETVTLD